MDSRNHRLHDDAQLVPFIASPRQSEGLDSWFVHYLEGSA